MSQLETRDRGRMHHGRMIYPGEGIDVERVLRIMSIQFGLHNHVDLDEFQWWTARHAQVDMIDACKIVDLFIHCGSIKTGTIETLYSAVTGPRVRASVFIV